MSHSQEPWSYKPDCRYSTIAELLDSKGHAIGAGDYDGAVSFKLHDARRIVACVNACEGVSTDTLEHAPQAIGSYIKQGAEHQVSIDTYRDLCGELLKALKAANQFIGNGIELGYIRMPDRDTPDAAHKTPALVRSSITKASAVMGENSNG